MLSTLQYFYIYTVYVIRYKHYVYFSTKKYRNKNQQLFADNALIDFKTIKYLKYHFGKTIIEIINCLTDILQRDTVNTEF